jgi:hypothetical protein
MQSFGSRDDPALVEQFSQQNVKRLLALTGGHKPTPL